MTGDRNSTPLSLPDPSFFVMTVFFGRADNMALFGDFENRPIVVECRRNRADSESAKFPFEFKRAVF